MKRLLIPALIFLLQAVAYPCFAQVPGEDSLKRIIRTSPDDTNKVNALNSLCIRFISNDLADSAFQYAWLSKDISGEIGFMRGQAAAYSLLANIYFYRGNYLEALKNNLASLKIKEKLGDEKGIANSYNNIGNVYNSLGNYDESLKNHSAALKIRERIGDTVNIGFSYNNIGVVQLKQGNYDAALKSHFESLKIKEKTNDREGKATSLLNIGAVYSELGSYPDALESLFAALEIQKEQDNKEGEEIAYVNLCNVYLKQKDYKTAEEYGLKALSLASEIGDVETIIEANLQLSTLYRETGNFEKALDHYSSYINIRDSLFNEESVKKVVQTQLQYEFDKTQAKKEAAAAAESKKQRIVILLVSCVLLLALIFAVITYRNYLKKQKANEIITRQKGEVEEQKKIIEEKNKDITGSITYAKRIQQAILPPVESVKELFPDSFALYRPKDIVAGDFYWVSEAVTKYQEKFVMAAVADCTGHGVPGALMSIIGNNYLRLCEVESTVNRPSEALDFINAGISRTLHQDANSTIKDGMDMVFVSIDYNASVLHFAGAKNPIYIVRAGVLTEYKGDRHSIGEELKQFTNHTIPVEKGDCVYLFSDGFADQFGGRDGKKFMYKRFKDLLAANSVLPMEKQYELLMAAFDEWKGDAEQVDDVCVLGIRI